MLGVQKEIESFSYVDISALEGINGKLEDSVRDSIYHYNKALELVRSKSEDIAILEIKRAINLNPHFNEAQNLLGLLLVMTGEEDKAVEVFKNVISEEKNSIKALDYIGKINGLAAASSLVFKDADLSTAPKKAASVKKKPKAEPVVKSSSGILENYLRSLKYHAAVYLIIFVLGAVIFGGKPPKTEVIQTADNSQEITELNTKIKELTDKNNALNDENSKLKGQVDKINTQAAVVQTSDKLIEAEGLISSRKYEQAVDLLLLLKDVQFNAADKDKYTKLLNDTLPKATWAVYLDGMNSFNAQDYKNATAKLSKSLTYGGSWDYTPDTYLKLGKAYQSLGDKQNALNTFNTLKTKYPNTQSAAEADSSINELNN